MNSFEESKNHKLRQLPVLKILNILGMIAWVEEYGEANQRLRLLHPLSWVWLFAMIVCGIFMYGFIAVKGEIKNVFQEETVWF